VLSRLDAWLLEQSVIFETRFFANCSDELEKVKWGDWTEVRRMEPEVVFKIAKEPEEQLRELGRKDFAAQYVPTTPEQRQTLTTAKHDQEQLNAWSR
tara:strand:+ start:157 stop:447 length:291 start_codon:yes stop_codon:yes gene_type:complete